MKRLRLAAGSAALALLLATGCDWRGPLYPSGSSGSYFSDFSSAAQVSDWGSLAGGGTLGVSLDSSTFFSAPSSGLFSAGSAAAGSLFYLKSGLVSLSRGDTSAEFLFDPAGLATPGSPANQFEFILVSNGRILADLGYDPNNASLYTYNNGTAKPLGSLAAGPNFHDLAFVYHGTSGTSDYFADNLELGRGYNAAQNLSNTAGLPGVTFAVLLPGGANGAIRLDDLQVSGR